MQGRRLVWMLVVVLGLWPRIGQAVRWQVSADGTGDFRTLQEGLHAAQPGDVILVAPGTYAERLTTQRHGTATARITVQAEPGAAVVITHPGRVLDVQHAFITVEGLVFDGQFGTEDLIRIRSGADHFILRRSEVRRSARDCIDMESPREVLIEAVRIHHCLFWDGQRRDAHGITGGGVQGLTVRQTEIFYVSGDAIQFAPSRARWDRITVEQCHFWNGPLPADAAGFAAGTVTGENALDTKAPAGGAPARLTIRDCRLHGFQGVMSNQAALNLKEHVEASVDRVTIYDADIALRLRAPARVTVTNCVLYDVGRGVRYEDGIEVLRLYNCTFGRNVARPFQDVGGRPDVRSTLFRLDRLPSEATTGRNLAVSASAFVDAARHDYRLMPGAAAIDAGESLPGVSTDRDGISRPQGSAADVGAYEFVTDATDLVPPAPPGRVRVK